MSDPVTERHPDISSLERLLFLEFDKHERMQALFEVAELFESERYWKQLGDVWVGSESIFQDLEIMDALWEGCGIHDLAQFDHRYYALTNGEETLMLALRDSKGAVTFKKASDEAMENSGLDKATVQRAEDVLLKVVSDLSTDTEA